MGALIEGDDGLPAQEVHSWAKEKHDRLLQYLALSRGPRLKWLGPEKAGATYIDLFCGPGRARVKKTGEWIEGSAVAAWNISNSTGAPFSEVYIADIDEEARSATVERLRRLGAPVRELKGTAIEAASEVITRINPYGLHFAFIDPYSLGALDFSIIRSLSSLKRMDMLIHLSAMDLRRNLLRNLNVEDSALDKFAPGWRQTIDQARPQLEVRRQLVKYWKDQVTGLGKRPSTRLDLITGSNGQPLYWLLLAAENDLAHKFWKVATDTGQGSLDF